MNKWLILISVFFTSNTFAQATPSDVVDMTQSSNSAKIKVTSPKDKKEDETDQSNSDSKKRIEKIEVTGSYIRRIDTEGPSPLVTIDKEDFEVAGIDTVNDYMKEDPLFNGSTDSGDRAGYFNFRGQHAGSSLILLNGIRMPKLGGPGRGFYNGVQSISTNVLERVEILKDGSSALYGSDAQTGVINFITKKDYDGAEFATRINMPEIGVGLQQNHNISFGKNYNKGNWLASVQYTEQQAYTELDIGNNFTGDYRPLGTSGSSQINNESSNKFENNCTNGSKKCSTDSRGQDFVRDRNQSIGTLLTGRYDISSDLNITMLGMYNQRIRNDVGLPNAIGFNKVNRNQLKTAQIGSQKLTSNSTSPNDLFSLNFYPNDEVGLRVVDVVQDSYTAQSKIEGYFADTWTWNVSGGYAYSIENRNHRNGLVNMDSVTQKLGQGFDPSNLGQNSGALGDSRVQGVESYEASMTSARLLTTGELFDFRNLWSTGGPMSLAVGAEGQWETTNDNHDQILIDSNLNETFAENQFGSRSVSSAFVELVSYPLDSLEVQMAGRYDSYSDVGDTFNPKLALGWRPSNKVLIRGSWGTTFTAPSVRNLIQRDEPGFEDYAFCTPEQIAADSCEDKNLEVTRYRDPNLTNETGVNYNIGTVIQPTKNWTFTIDQWNFEGKNTIAALGSAYESIYETAGEEGLNAAGVTLIKNTDGEITGANIPFVVNQGELVTRGIDLDISFNSKIKLFGKVLNSNLGTRHSHTVVRKSQSSPVSAPYSYGDLEWKNTTSASLSTRIHSVRLAARSAGGNTGSRYSTDSHSEYDFTYGYTTSWSGRFSLGVKNLVNRRPPTNRNSDFIDFTRDRDTYAFQPLGRRYWAGYKQSF